MVDWSRRPEDPIPLPEDRQLITLKDAGGLRHEAAEG